jgi:demethylmenaquinone methyltransferase/2-methoxy-6-polyprenyl-1,4-benzoquinol methylase
MRPRIGPGRRPDRQAALAQYKRRAKWYDNELLLFEPIRAEAIALLQLRPGDVVLDIGAGTGLSFDRLEGRIGPSGRIVAIEQSPEMMDQARERAAANHWRNIELVQAAAATARIPVPADAALFHFTHDILRDEAALDNVFAHLKPGARVAAAGLQWAPPWALPTNGFVMLAALYSTTSLEGLGHPWSLLERRLSGFAVQHTLLGGIYIASGTYAARHH